MQYIFTPRGVCSREIYIELDGKIIKKVKFLGGCSGNTAGLAAMVEGLTVDEVIKKLRGIKCGEKETSCPDQLAVGLLEALDEI